MTNILLLEDLPEIRAWLSSLVLQVFPDRFARSAAAAGRETPPWAVRSEWDEPVRRGPTGHYAYQLYGGDLDGIVEHLDHLARLHADVLYLTPVFPAGSTHRYDAARFDQVDPLLGGDAALQRLTAAARRSGGLIDAATSAATPKYAPCGRPAMKRNASPKP